MSEIWLRRRKRTHAVKCFHDSMEYYLAEGANSVEHRCAECGYVFKRLGYDDMPVEARNELIQALKESDDEEAE